MKQIKTKLIAAVLVSAVFLVGLAFVATPAKADQFDAQIQALKAQIAQSQAAASQKASEANTLKNKVAQIDAQVYAAQGALRLTDAQIRQTQAEIDRANRDLDRQKGILKDNLRLVYKQGEVSPLELIASSKNLSDFVAQSQYLNAIKNKINSNLKKIDELKGELVKRQGELNTLALQQKTQVDNIAQQRAQQAELLAKTQGDEAQYQNMVLESNKKLQGIYAERASYDRLNNVAISTGGSGGYPWANAATNYDAYCRYPDGSIGADPWGGCLRQCTSFAGWHRRTFRDGSAMPQGWGNAKDWVSHAAAPGSPARVGAIAVFPPGVGGAGSVGHVAIVTSVGSGVMSISEYNWMPFSYSNRSNVPTANVRFIY